MLSADKCLLRCSRSLTAAALQVNQRLFKLYEAEVLSKPPIMHGHCYLCAHPPDGGVQAAQSKTAW